MNHPAPSCERRPAWAGRLRPFWAALALAMVLAPALQVQGSYVESPDLGDATVGVLLYQDESQYRWADVPVTGNFTALCATLSACTAQNVPLNYSMSQYGAYVTSLFGVKAPDDFSWWWEILIWNNTALAWQEAPAGASDLRLRMWDNIAWCPNRSAPPLPDPLTRYPSPKFRGDLANTGKAPVPYPTNDTGSKTMTFSNGPIDSTPAVVHGRIYFSTGGVYNWSRMIYDEQPQLWSVPVSRYNNGAGAYYNTTTTAAGWQVSSPAVGAGMVVIGTSDGKVMAFTIDELKPLWNYSIGASATGVTASPVIFQDVIYIAGGNGLLYGLSTDGKMLWNLSLGGPAYMSTPAISNGRLFVGSDAGVLTCAALNGTFLWNFTAGGKIRSSPAVSGGRVFFENTIYDGFTATGSTLFSLVASNGTLDWNRTIPASTSSPAIADGRLFLGTNTGVMAHDLQGNLLWTHATPGPIQASPTVGGDTVIVAENSPNGTIRILSAVDGRELRIIGPKPEQYLFSSPVLAGDMLVFASDNGYVYVHESSDTSMLAVEHWDIPQGLEPGKNVQVKITITNRGNLTSHNIRLVLNGPQGRFNSPLNISYLAPGHNITAVFNWTPKEGDTGLGLSFWESGSIIHMSGHKVQVASKRTIPAQTIFITISLIIVLAVGVAMLVRRRARKGGA